MKFFVEITRRKIKAIPIVPNSIQSKRCNYSVRARPVISFLDRSISYFQVAAPESSEEATQQRNAESFRERVTCLKGMAVTANES